jgi:hypothetical protein
LFFMCGTYPPEQEPDIMATPFDTTTTAPTTTVKVASEAAVSYCAALMVEKAVSTGADAVVAAASINTWLDGRSAREVSDSITRLKAEGFTGRAAAAAPADAGQPSAEVVPAGRYAVATEDGAVNELAFYKVDRPTEGRWAGFVFVKLIVSDDEQRLSKAASAAVLAKIAAVGAEAASAAYGLEIGECGVCSRTLTNDASRERGIGPVCAEKMGW